MYTTIAWSESIDAGAAFVNLTAVVDQHIKTSGDFITVGSLNKLIGAHACIGTNAEEARLLSPSLRRVNPYYITPVNAALVPDAEARINFRPDNPIDLDVNESLEAEIKADPAAAEQVTVVAFLSDGVLNPIQGQMFTVNCEITLALVAGAWAFSEVSFPDSLPVADYAVCGARVITSAGVVFRLVPVGSPWRPGGCTVQAVGSKDPYHQRYGRLGQWFIFNSVQLPGIEVLSSAAAGSATYQCYLDLLKIT